MLIKMLYELGVNLVFLNEPLINTSVFDSTKNNLLNINIETGNSAVDSFFRGNIELINNFMMALSFTNYQKETVSHTQIGGFEANLEPPTIVMIIGGF